MAVKIRLSRLGTKNKPSYRVVITPARSKRDGKFIEIIGHYNPLVHPPLVKIEQKRFDYWISCGAQPTGAVKKILKIKP
ncbi:MAG: 30S ribosomal protein S16 [bacterium]|nr:30S ribosomal protein S16 [bacterium]